MTLFSDREEINEYLKNEVLKICNRHGVPGAAVGVITGGETIFSEGFGFSNLEDGAPFLPSTLFPIGSCTKSFSAAIALKVLEEKKIPVDANLFDWLPCNSMADVKFSRLTIEDLICHTSGWDDLPKDKMKGMSRSEFLEVFFSSNLEKLGSKKWKYSNDMYVLLGILVEELTGKDWTACMNDILLGPLEMKSSGLEDAKSGTKAQGYVTREGEQVEVTLDKETTLTSPNGGLWSSINDMFKWMKMWLNEDEGTTENILTRVQVKEAIKMQRLISTELDSKEKDHFFGSGYGWMVDSYKSCYRVGHKGMLDGFTSFCSLFPMNKSGLVIFANQGNSIAVNEIAIMLSDFLLEVPVKEEEKMQLQGVLHSVYTGVPAQ